MYLICYLVTATTAHISVALVITKTPFSKALYLLVN